MLWMVGNGRNKLEIIDSQQIETFNLKTGTIIVTISSEGQKPFNVLQPAAIFPITRGIFSVGWHWERYIKDLRTYENRVSKHILWQPRSSWSQRWEKTLDCKIALLFPLIVRPKTFIFWLFPYIQQLLGWEEIIADISHTLFLSVSSFTTAHFLVSGLLPSFPFHPSSLAPFRHFPFDVSAFPCSAGKYTVTIITAINTIREMFLWSFSNKVITGNF